MQVCIRAGWPWSSRAAKLGESATLNLGNHQRLDPLTSRPPNFCRTMFRCIPVNCTTWLVTCGGQKPTTCALLHLGVKSLPCECLDPLTSLPPNFGRSMVRNPSASFRLALKRRLFYPALILPLPQRQHQQHSTNRPSYHSAPHSTS